MRPHPFLILALVGALIGFTFASVSTFDFAQHLDRQVHGLHCSFIPGLEEQETGSDCEVTLMSPYSSVARSDVWGGIPISLAAMGVFAFLLFFAFELLFGRRQQDRNATGFYALATLLPVGTSGVMAFISLQELDAACKQCIGIYTGSIVCMVGAVGLFISAMRSSKFARMAASNSMDDLPAASSDAWSMGEDADLDEPIMAPRRATKGAPPAGPGVLIGAFFIGCAFVAVPVMAYVVNAPDHSKFIGECGKLDKPPADELLIPIGPQSGAPALEIFDPLCPACRGFEEHLETTPYHDQIARQAILFPLDAECNWMLGESVHHGACTISEAVVCAEGDADDVIQWAFDNQEAILAASKSDTGAAKRMVAGKFPHLEKCIGSPKAKQKVNRSLRWAVDNNLKILTPQLYINGVRLCDEDVDLGLEFALSRMVK